jgi:hypothetical protein
MPLIKNQIDFFVYPFSEFQKRNQKQEATEQQAVNGQNYFSMMEFE